jgi:3'-phosphoadenosine 5'-phosphosulfate sulfotransferase (PAPS reductase)/FAD synthetase
MKRVVSWFSGGVSSFIAAYLMREQITDIIYIDIADQHPDTIRFLHDCEQALGKEIQIIKSEKFNSVNEVIQKKKFINSPYGARCTLELKKKVREDWERKQESDLIYVWGYDVTEQHRADRLQATMFEYDHIFPLIDYKFTKKEVHGVLEKLGIKRPTMYELGYPNNNCVGCVKGGMGYWNKIRNDFPEVFTERAKIEREIGRSCLKGIFLDELDPQRGRLEMEIMPECGIMCERMI